jgi:hypothetical protein
MAPPSYSAIHIPHTRIGATPPRMLVHRMLIHTIAPTQMFINTLMWASMAVTGVATILTIADTVPTTTATLTDTAIVADTDITDMGFAGGMVIAPAMQLEAVSDTDRDLRRGADLEHAEEVAADASTFGALLHSASSNRKQINACGGVIAAL